MAEDYHEIFKTEFKFTNQPLSERTIEINFERRDSGESWMLALQSADKVCVTTAVHILETIAYLICVCVHNSRLRLEVWISGAWMQKCWS